MASKATPATATAQRAEVNHRLHTYTHDRRERGFGNGAVEALGLDPRRTFKTLIAVGEAGSPPVCAVVSVAAQLDLKALAAVAGAKQMAMADAVLAERVTGYVVGGISPLGQKRLLAVFIDFSACEYPTIFVSGGRRGLEIELSPTDLAQLVGATFCPIAREEQARSSHRWG